MFWFIWDSLGAIGWVTIGIRAFLQLIAGENALLPYEAAIGCLATAWSGLIDAIESRSKRNWEDS